jgi:predicted LPLAT superfamily acyltransferase
MSATSSTEAGFVGGLYRLIRRMGVWVVALFAWVISTFYFLLFPRRLRNSLRFYRALFPDRGPLSRLACSWRQYKSFASLFSERLALEGGREPPFESEGWEHLEQAAAAGTGGIILTSHVGNWEVAARLFRRRKLRMMIYMGARRDEQVERIQKSELRAEQLEVVSVGDDGGSPLDGLQGLKFLKEGGFVAMAGDRLWQQEQRQVSVSFLGRQISIPQAPFAFAMVARAPLFICFAFKKRDGSYQISSTQPQHVRPASRGQRDEAIQQAAQSYASLLEEKIRCFPYQWYHFERFL